jgi:hypothetical protein
MSKKPKAPPPPPAPDYGTLWKQYSGWTAQAAANRDSTISNARSRLTAAGADKSVIAAMEADAMKEFESKMTEYKSGSTYKLLQEGYDIARGAKANIYSGKAKGTLYAPGSETVDTIANPKWDAGRLGSKGEGAMGSKFIKKAGGTLNSMEDFYAGGYTSGEVEVDAKAENLKKTKLQSGGMSGGSEIKDSPYNINPEEAGANPWVA